MDVRVIAGQECRTATVDELPAVLADPDALVWVDMPTLDDESLDTLRTVFRFHPVAVHECRTRQRMPKIHAYADHLYVVLHAPELGANGHVHYVELDQFVGARYLVTVHGPVNQAVPEHVPVRDTLLVWERIQEGRFHPRTAVEISTAIVVAMTRGMEETLEAVTQDVWDLEQRVTSGHLGDAELFLDEMFRTRHALLVVSNMTGGAVEVGRRALSVAAEALADEDRRLVADTVDQLGRVHRLADVQREYLQGVIEFYRTRTDTKMTIAAERLAVIAVVTLPITALASVLGMNVIVNARTEPVELSVALLVMIVMSLYLVRWARKHGWW